jgi:hypothetical protein
MSEQHPVAGLLPVKTVIPVEQYRRLVKLADEQHVSVAQIVADIIERAVVKNPPHRRSNYTPEIGRRIVQMRRLNRSWKEIAKAEHMHLNTAAIYAARYQEDQARRATPKGL